MFHNPPSELHNPSFTIRPQSFTIRLQSCTISVSQSVPRVSQSVCRVSQSAFRVAQSQFHNPSSEFDNRTLEFHNPSFKFRNPISSFTIPVSQSARQVSQSKFHNPTGKFHNPTGKFHNPTLTCGNYWSFQDTGNANKFKNNQVQTIMNTTIDKVNIPLFKCDPTCASSSKLKPWWVFKFGLNKLVQILVPSLVWASTSSKRRQRKIVGPVVAGILYCWINNPSFWVVYQLPRIPEQSSEKRNAPTTYFV